MKDEKKKDKECKAGKIVLQELYTTLKAVCDFDGNAVKRGEKILLTDKQAKHFKKNKAI